MSATFPAEPFYLKTETGRRFCLYHAPSSGKACLGVFIYVHPFCDEMNKSRRMAAMQARAFATAGFGVLQIDLFGCGDSEGEFGDARWTIWKQDLACAWDWLEDRASSPISLWGLRLGALLALDFASDWGRPIDRIILWQPVIDGTSFLNQFLRLRMANEMLGSAADSKKPTGTNALRDRLANGETLEVAGYDLAPGLASAIDTLKAAERVVAKCPVYWFEVVAEPGRSMTPAATNVVNQWRREGVDPHVHLVPCAPFWATQEISECPELISITVNVLAETIS
ncbi:MAG TPA: hydrolase 2, exosortase A system-associated [Nitrosospira sp.]